MNTQFLNLPEGKIAFDDTGSGPLAICVPGMGDLRQEYRYLAPQLLAAGYRVVTMDVRGHGETSLGWQDYSVAGVGADILALARSLDAGPVIIFGSSMAAVAAVWAAAEAVEWVSGLVLLGPVVQGESSWQVRLLLNVLFARPWGPSAWLKYYSTLFTMQKPPDFDQYTAMLKRNIAEPGRLEALQQMMLAPKTESAVRLARVKAPTLLLMGSKDPDFKDPRAEVVAVAEQLKGSYQVIDGAGHYPQTEFPERTGTLILDFLAKLQPEAVLATPARG
ncbi:MAG: alpha/beta hydrolase [Anaerolineaceae bacterium]|nr:alpha/beta hydrolase [Anaerolineaceae bacterium]